MDSLANLLPDDLARIEAWLGELKIKKGCSLIPQAGIERWEAEKEIVKLTKTLHLRLASSVFICFNRSPVGSEPALKKPRTQHNDKTIGSSLGGDMSKTLDAAGVSRRAVLSGTVALIATSCSSTSPSPSSTPAPQAAASAFTAQERATLRAVIDRLVPSDEFSPAASECGVLDYFDRCLGEWNQNDVPLLRGTLAVLDAQARERGGEFAALDADAQDELLMAMEAGEFPEAAGQAGFNRLLRLTLEGMFSDPYYGGNRNYAGWDLIGYPGAVPATTAQMQAMGGRLPALHTSAYGAEHDGH